MELLLIIIGLAIFLGFFVQSTLGFAAPLVALPLLLFVFELHDSIALISIFLFLFTALQTPFVISRAEKKVVKKLFLPLSFGVFLGVFVLDTVNTVFLEKGLGILTLYFVFSKVFSWNKSKCFTKYGQLMGFLGGVSGGMFGAGGIFIIAYLYDTVSDSQGLRATMIVLLGVINFFRLPIMWGHGMIPEEIFLYSLLFLPLFLLSIFLGNMFQKQISTGIYKNIILGLLFISGCNLLIF